MKTAFLAVLLLASCASLPAGIEMSEDEAKACKEFGCSVWTEQEIRNLAQRFYGEGYKAGRQSL